MENHKELNPRMWTIVVDWLCKVSDMLKLHDATFFLSVHLLKRCIQCFTAIPPIRLQLYAATALFVASKFEELLAPPMHDFLYVCGGAYTTEDFIRTEAELLTLHWDIFDEFYERVKNFEGICARNVAKLVMSNFDIYAKNDAAALANVCESVSTRPPASCTRTNYHWLRSRDILSTSHLPADAHMRSITDMPCLNGLKV